MAVIKMKVQIKILLLTVCIAFSIPCSAQFLKNIETSFSNHQTKNVQEKVFVHTDKDSYIMGEILWFKAYIINDVTGLPSELSKVAYVEILDRNNKPIEQAKTSIEKGSGNGSISLNNVSKSDIYKLRVYTNWMKNFGPHSYFEKELRIINPTASPDLKPQQSNKLAVQFFPEGGNMVDGLNTVVGIKAVDSYGVGIDVNGIIVNQKNDTVARFKTHKFGIGRFVFTPIPNEHYRAVITAEKEKHTAEFPIAKKTGYALSVKSDQIESITVLTANNISENRGYLIVHDGKLIQFSKEIIYSNGKSTIDIPKTQFGEGVSNITLFNEKGVPVAERLFFKPIKNEIKIATNISKSTYATRDRVTLGLDLGGAKNMPHLDFSVSVSKADELGSENIITSFLLTSALKGKVESPTYYLNNTEESNLTLDNLLITQGWRKFNWDDIKTEKPLIKFLPEYSGHLITGKVFKADNTPSTYADLYLGIPGKLIQFYESVSNKQGDFIFNTYQLYGNNEVVVMNKSADTTIKITLNSPFSDQFTPFAYQNLNYSNLNTDKLTDESFGIQVQKNFVGDKLNNFNVLNTDTTLFYGKASKTYIFNNYERFNNMEESLREFVKETFVLKNSAGFQVKLLANDVPLQGNPLVLLDGIPYFDMNKVMKIDPTKIAKLEVVPTSYQLGSSKFDGILAFTSYKTSLANIDINSNALVVDYEGLQNQREFYTPSYESEDQKASSLPDFRSTLYWNPNVVFDKDGKAKVDFFTSDVPGNYIGIVNGIDDNGSLGTSYFTFKVDKK
ncbi:MAG: hypothetical protein EOO47_10675 [Flavobacterium sp.]|nr:MAG: hypothetical protein EOO47_10675 [Flavobacterium sp.]